jgi:hypothetical protein
LGTWLEHIRKGPTLLGPPLKKKNKKLTHWPLDLGTGKMFFEWWKCGGSLGASKKSDGQITNLGRPVGDWTLKHSGQAGSKGRPLLFLVSKQNLNPPPLGASDILIIVENGLEIRKLWPLKIKRVKNSKKKTTEHYKSRFLNTQKIPCILFCCYESSKMICRILGGIPITL